MSKKWILSYASAMSMDAYAIYDTTDQVLDEMKDYFGDPELTLEIIMDHQWQREAELDIQECLYIPSQIEVRNNKINEIIE